jgi:hypothetical protein
MHHVQRRKLDAASRVVVFDRTDPHPSPAARASMDRLEALLAHVEEVEEAQQRSLQEAREALLERDRAADSLTLRLSQLGRLLAAVAVAEGRPQLRVRLSRNGKYGCLALAREALARAEDHRELLREYGLPETLPDKLADDIARWQAAEERRAECAEQALRATATFVNAAREAHTIIRHLDALTHLRYGGNPALLAAWEAASAVRWNKREGRSGASAPLLDGAGSARAAERLTR